MQFGKLLHRSSYYLFPGLCVACNLPSERPFDLCRMCESVLPRPACSCSICAEPLASAAICGNCQRQPPPYSRVVAPLLFAPPVDRLIHRFKYHRDLTAATVLTAVLGRHLATLLKTGAAPDLLVPVPLHWTRLCKRGYNQAGEIARLLSADLDIPVAKNLLVRHRRTPASQGLSREQRSKNLRHAFAVSSGNIDAMRIALVDDVVTSTSTASILAALLRRHGARQVEVWCLARTPLEK